MKTRELELKDIVGYSMHGLKFQIEEYTYHGVKEKYIDKLTSIYLYDNLLSFDNAPDFYLKDININSSKIKPILHDISCLTEEIESIKKIINWTDSHDEWWEFQYPDYEQMMENCPRNVLDELYKRMVDVNFLIPAGLAINIKDIK